MESTLLPDEHLKDENDVEAILRLAVQRQSIDGTDLRERLEKSAAELDIPPEVLAQAEAEYKSKKQAEIAEIERQKAAALEHKDRVRKFFLEAGPFGIGIALVIGLLVWANLSGSHGMWWVVFPVMFWGMRLTRKGKRAFERNDDQYHPNNTAVYSPGAPPQHTGGYNDNLEDRLNTRN